MVTVANVDLTGWTKQGSTPIYDGNYPSQLRPLSGNTVFYGYSKINVSSISINSIVTASTDTTAPMALFASASDVTCVGTRTLTSTSIIPYEDLDFAWKLTHSDDSPVEDLEGLLDPRTTSAVNPYTDQISPEFTCIIREPGSYKLTLWARGMTSTSLTVLEQVATKTITCVASSQTHQWYDGVSGSDSNEGLDPNGFALTNGTYTESSGELTSTGAFASYTHDVSMNFTDRSNYIHISKAGFVGLYKIASKTNSNTIVLADKLGSDQTAITSSSGAKQTYTGSAVSGEETHLKTDSTYTITSAAILNGKALPVAISGYGSGVKPIVTNTTLSGQTGGMVDYSTNASGSLPDYIRLSNINYDAMGNSRVLGGICTTTNDLGSTTYIFDRIDCVHGTYSSGLNVSGQASTINFNILIYRTYVDNRYGTTGKAISRQGVYTDFRNGSWTRMMGCIIDNDADNSNLDHYYYPNGDMNHFHGCYSHMRDGSGSSHGYNTNAEENDNQHLSFNHNLFSDNTNWGIDFSNSNNDPSLKYFSNVSVMHNECGSKKALSILYSQRTGRFAYNQVWGAGGASGSAHFNSAIVPGSGSKTVVQLVVDNNHIYGQQIGFASVGFTLEATDNIVEMIGDNWAFDYSSGNQSGQQFAIQDNNFYAPSITASEVINNVSTGETIATFEAAQSGASGNTSTDPSWTDPATGDMGNPISGLTVTVI